MVDVIVCCRWTFPWPIPPPLSLVERGKGRPRSIGVNGMYVWTGRGGQRRLSAFAESAKNGWIKIVVDAQRKLPPGALALDLALYPPDGIRRDADGPIKLAQDALFEAYLLLFVQAGYPFKQAKLLADDYRVVDLHVHRHRPDRANPRIEVAVRSWTEEVPPPT